MANTIIKTQKTKDAQISHNYTVIIDPRVVRILFLPNLLFTIMKELWKTGVAVIEFGSFT